MSLPPRSPRDVGLESPRKSPPAPFLPSLHTISPHGPLLPSSPLEYEILTQTRGMNHHNGQTGIQVGIEDLDASSDTWSDVSYVLKKDLKSPSLILQAIKALPTRQRPRNDQHQLEAWLDIEQLEPAEGVTVENLVINLEDLITSKLRSGLEFRVGGVPRGSNGTNGGCFRRLIRFGITIAIP